MRPFWTLLKVAIAACFIIPIGIIVLTMTLGVLGALFGLAVMALRLAIIGLVALGAFRLIARLLRRPAASPPRQIEVPKADPYYEAAMRELDRDMGPVR